MTDKTDPVVEAEAARLQAIYREGAGGMAYNDTPIPTYAELVARGEAAANAVRGWRALARHTLGLAAVTLALLLLAGCAGAQDPLRRALHVGGEGLAAADTVTAEAYERAAADALREAEDLAEYRALMSTWDGAEQALRVTRGALLTAEAALDAWEAGGRERWPEVAACALGAVAHLLAILDALEVDIPDALSDAVALFGGVAQGVCPGGEHG